MNETHYQFVFLSTGEVCEIKTPAQEKMFFLALTRLTGYGEMKLRILLDQEPLSCSGYRFEKINTYTHA